MKRKNGGIGRRSDPRGGVSFGKEKRHDRRRRLGFENSRRYNAAAFYRLQKYPRKNLTVNFACDGCETAGSTAHCPKPDEKTPQTAAQICPKGTGAYIGNCDTVLLENMRFKGFSGTAVFAKDSKDVTIRKTECALSENGSACDGFSDLKTVGEKRWQTAVRHAEIRARRFSLRARRRKMRSHGKEQLRGRKRGQRRILRLPRQSVRCGKHLLQNGRRGPVRERFRRKARRVLRKKVVLKTTW